MTVAQFRATLTELVEEHDFTKWCEAPAVINSIDDSKLEALMLRVQQCSKCGAEHEGPAICEPCGRWECR